MTKRYSDVPCSNLFVPSGIFPEDKYLKILDRGGILYSTLERIYLSDYLISFNSLTTNPKVWTKNYRDMSGYGKKAKCRRFGNIVYYKMYPTESGKSYPWIQLCFDKDYIKLVKELREKGDRRIEVELYKLGIKMDDRGRWQVAMHNLILTSLVGPRPLSEDETRNLHNWMYNKGGFSLEDIQKKCSHYVGRHYKFPNINNYSIDNLQWGTQKDNCADKINHYKGDSNHNGKLEKQNLQSII